MGWCSSHIMAVATFIGFNNSTAFCDSLIPPSEKVTMTFAFRLTLLLVSANRIAGCCSRKRFAI